MKVVINRAYDTPSVSDGPRNGRLIIAAWVVDELMAADFPLLFSK